MVTLVRSDGMKFAYGDIFNILSYGLTGTGALSMEIFSEKKAQGDGNEITAKRATPRTIDIHAVCVHRSANRIARRVANKFFSPVYEYEFHIDYKGTRAWIPCHLEAFELPTENIHRPQILKVSLFCPDPFYLSEDSYGKNIAQVTGMIGFPYIDLPRIGFIASVFNFSQSVFIQNNGDVNTYPVIEITAKGEVENPEIQKDEYFVRVLDTMRNGDKIIIDFNTKRVTKNDENISNKLSKDSRLTRISFERGTNRISYAAAHGENVMNVFVYFNERYVGV